MAISRHNVSILLCFSMNGTRRLPRRALRLCPPRNDKTESFSVNRLVGADAHIGPSTNVTNFLEIAEIFCWGDVGIAPYDLKSEAFLQSEQCNQKVTPLSVFMHESKSRHHLPSVSGGSIPCSVPPCRGL